MTAHRETNDPKRCTLTGPQYRCGSGPDHILIKTKRSRDDWAQQKQNAITIQIELACATSGRRCKFELMDFNRAAG